MSLKRSFLGNFDQQNGRNFLRMVSSSQAGDYIPVIHVTKRLSIQSVSVFQERGFFKNIGIHGCKSQSWYPLSPLLGVMTVRFTVFSMSVATQRAHDCSTDSWYSHLMEVLKLEVPQYSRLSPKFVLDILWYSWDHLDDMLMLPWSFSDSGEMVLKLHNLSVSVSQNVYIWLSGDISPCRDMEALLARWDPYPAQCAHIPWTYWRSVTWVHGWLLVVVVVVSFLIKPWSGSM